ncbi:MAG: OsmC family peroxiredoxin [Bacteroidetes bacterium]|nr:MAG: OsmC family peroxiredoxin [Bacteroidota bacterium]
MKEHQYEIVVRWTGNLGEGTSSYRSYSRDHVLEVAGKKRLFCSSDPMFRGDRSKHNPEELFIYALSSCHMLWYLHFCADQGIEVVEYQDQPLGMMVLGGAKERFKEVILKPRIVLKNLEQIELAKSLHEQAHEHCFIANSVNCEIRIEPEIT